MRKVYRALLIGAGSIGSKIKDPSSALPQNYVDAISAHTGFSLEAICDPVNTESVITHKDLDDLLDNRNFDVACVAAPTDQHALILKKLLGYGFKAVVVEKPMGSTLQDSIEIRGLYERNNIPLIVNYSRRYSQTFIDIGELIKSNKNKLLNITIRYAKGLKNNGSHAIDLIFILAGDIISATSLASCLDFKTDDPSISAHFKTKFCDNIFIHALDESCFTGFEVDITLCDRRFIIYNDHRDMDIWGVEENHGIPSGKRLVYRETAKTDYTACMTNLLNNLYGVLEGYQQPVCTARNACDVARIVEILKSRS